MVASAAALAVVTALVFLRSLGGGTSDHATSSATPSPSNSGGSAAPDPSGDALPGGYLLVDDEEGFSTAVPEAWDRPETNSPPGTFDVVYRSPDRTLFLRVFKVSEPTPGRPFEKVRNREDFEEVAELEPFKTANNSGLRLEYRIGSPGKVWYVVDSRFTAGDGNLYGVAVYRAGEEGPADEKLFSMPLRYFCPPGATCGEVTSPRE
ncbi:hypothetical protein [Streptomyces sp. TP-A0874]|uniref:hypothetical protein n=1 Tax=Streptomyces sp. TP-A0874 TaxID=549819 RepID=UPI000853B4E4|nr:hypothetical protein [Streptomyces sp. TP-A0874]